jgi:succinate dehydrogenase/fumarate reductase flavoprotein subunit
VVVGYGFAGGAAAIAAADVGASVLLIEKMPQPGGISITAGGGIRATDDADATFAYLQATNDGRTDDACIRAIADGMAATPAMLRELGAINGAEVVVRDFPGNYPYPGFDSLKMIDVLSIPGFDPAVTYPHAKGLKGGPNVFKVVEDNVTAREGITVWLNSPAKRLLRGPEGEVIGLTVEQHEGATLRIEAKGGVVLAAGGFENAPDIQQ